MSVEAAARRTVGRGVRLHAVRIRAVVCVGEVRKLGTKHAVLEAVDQPRGLVGSRRLAGGERVEEGVVHLVEAIDDRDVGARRTLQAEVALEEGPQRAIGALRGQADDVGVGTFAHVARASHVGLLRRRRRHAGFCAFGGASESAGADGIDAGNPVVVDCLKSAGCDAPKGLAAGGGRHRWE